MLITFQCTNCNTNLEIEADAAGAQLECPTCKAMVTVPRKEPGPGVTIGGFRIEKLLGRGGMGEVYLARQLSMDRDVALKILPGRLTLHKNIVDRFLREVRMLAKLEHPNIVTAHEAGEDGGVYYMAMAYVNGDSLDIKLRREGAMPEKQALQLILKIARALAYAWDEHRLIHRDIKPGNIMLDKQEKPRLMDLGLSKSLSQGVDITVSGGVVGTPNFMSPEQSRGGDIDFRSDMYSLGAALYNMLTGQVPFAGNSIVEVLRKQATEALPDPRSFKPDITGACVALLEIMLAKDPAQRHDDWNSLIADIDRVIAGRQPLREPLHEGESVLLKTQDGEEHKRIVLTHSEGQRLRERAGPKVRKPTSFAPAAVTILLVLVVALLGVMVYAWKTRKPVPPPAVVVSKPAPVEQTATATRADALAKRFADAVRYEQEHPDDLAGAIRLFELIGADGLGTEYEVKAAAEVRRLQASRQAAVTELMAKMESQAESLYAEGRAEESVRSLRDYTGPWAGETQVQRQELADRFAKRAEEERQAVSKQVEAARAKLDRIVDEVAAALFRGNAVEAEAGVTAAGQDADLKPLADDLTALRTAVEAAVSMPKTILDSFSDEVGKEVTIGFITGPQRLKIMSVGPGEVRAQRDLSAAGFAKFRFTVDELSLPEKFKRLEGQDSSVMGILRGLLLVQARKPMAAMKHFVESDTRLGKALAAQIDQRMAGVREAEAEKALVGLRRVAGLPVGSEITDDRLSRVRRTAYPPSEASRISGSAAEIRRQYGDTKVVAESDRVLRVLERVGTAPTEVDPALLEQAIKRVEEANPRAKPLVSMFDVNDENIELDLSKNAELADISSLRGLPINKLNLAKTKVRDLSPLRMMPLRSLDLTDCPVEQIDDLEGAPLKVLTLTGTKVRSIRPLKGAPLEELNLCATSVDMITTLSGMPLKKLDLGSCPVEDFRPLRSCPLEWLSLWKTRVPDLKVLKGMSLKSLNVTATRIVDLSPLEGMPLESLSIAVTAVSDLAPVKALPLKNLEASYCWNLGNLKPLAGMSLKSLNVMGTSVGDISPLMGMSTLVYIGLDDWQQFRIMTPIRDKLQRGELDAAATEASEMAKALNGVPAFASVVQALRALADTKIAEWKTMAGDIKSSAKSFNGHRYAVSPSFYDMKKAQSYCSEQGAHLATIGGKEEMDWVTATFAMPGIPVRLGGTDEKKEGVWEWLTGEPWGYSNWQPGQPDNWQGNEDAVIFFAGGAWQDIGVDIPCLFLMEWDP